MSGKHDHVRKTVRFDRPVIDEQTDLELRARYFRGQISIGTYLDRRFGTTFSSTGSTPATG
jgi:hypothetical protein